MSEVIGERDYELHSETGMEYVVKVVIYKPYEVIGEQDAWKCEWEVRKPGKTVKRYGIGIDSLQALRIALSMLKHEVESLVVEYKGRVTFLNQNLLWL